MNIFENPATTPVAASDDVSELGMYAPVPSAVLDVTLY